MRILRRAEDVVRLTLCSFVLRVLFDRQHFGNQLKLAMRITQGLAESGQIAITVVLPTGVGFPSRRRPACFKAQVLNASM